MTDTGDIVNPDFRKVPPSKGHQTTYHVYEGETRVGRVGKLIADDMWQAYSVTGKKVGESVKTRAAAGAVLIAVPLPAPPPLAPVYDAPEDPDVEEEIEKEIGPDDVIELAPISAVRAEGEDIEMSDRMHDTYETIASHDTESETNPFPSTHETDVTQTPEQPVPAAPASTPSAATTSRPPLWARIKAWFRDA